MIFAGGKTKKSVICITKRTSFKKFGESEWGVRFCSSTLRDFDARMADRDCCLRVEVDVSVVEVSESLSIGLVGIKLYPRIRIVFQRT